MDQRLWLKDIRFTPWQMDVRHAGLGTEAAMQSSKIPKRVLRHLVSGRRKHKLLTTTESLSSNVDWVEKLFMVN